MDARTVAEWKDVLGRLPSPEGTPVEEVAAQRVLSDLHGYYHGSLNNRRRDVKELANVLAAWSEMTAPAADTTVPAVYRDGRPLEGVDS